MMIRKAEVQLQLFPDIEPVLKPVQNRCANQVKEERKRELYLLQLQFITNRTALDPQLANAEQRPAGYGDDLS